MTEEERLLTVKNFFEADNYRDYISRMYEPEMKSAIAAYILENRDFAAVRVDRLVACLDIEKSQQLKDVLFKALDLWAENHFAEFSSISQKMEAYVLRVSQTLEDYFSYGKYTNPAGLRQIDLLKQYLNQALSDKNKAALWLKYFPAYFQNDYRYSFFSLVFLLMMLDEKQNILSRIPLEKETLNLLINCGYHYIAFSGANPHRAFERGDFTEAENIETIFAVVIKLAVKNKLYLREDHDNFRYALAHYINYCIPEQFAELLLLYDEDFNQLAGEMILRNLTVRNVSYQKDHRSKILALVEAIPKNVMNCCKKEWAMILEETKK